jgi:hypothetical protein
MYTFRGVVMAFAGFEDCLVQLINPTTKIAIKKRFKIAKHMRCSIDAFFTFNY